MKPYIYINLTATLSRLRKTTILLRLNQIDYSLILVVITLSWFGIIAVFWAGLSPHFSNPYSLVITKVRILTIALFLSILLSAVDYRLYQHKAIQVILIFTAIFGLIFLIILGHYEFGAIQRIMLFKQTIQPTEYCKVIVVILLAHTITSTYRRNLVDYLVFSGHTLLLATLFVLIALQPDYGAILIILGTSVGMLIIAKQKIKKIVFFVGLALTLAGGLFVAICIIVKDNFYVLDRLINYWECLTVHQCSQFQMVNSYNCIISGKIFGNSMTDAIHPHGLLPMSCNDFIFSVFAEEMGFFGVTLLSYVYILFLGRGFYIAKYSKDFFAQLLAFGLTWMIGFQTIINILIATGLFPVTGITLPFISHGGNSFLSMMIAVGILLNISKTVINPVKWIRKPSS